MPYRASNIGEDLVSHKLEKDQCVYIHWLDSTNMMGGWVYDKLTAKAKDIETVGFIVDVNDKAVMVSSTRSDSGGVVNPISIPLGCIQDTRLFEIR